MDKNWTIISLRIAMNQIASIIMMLKMTGCFMKSSCSTKGDYSTT